MKSNKVFKISKVKMRGDKINNKILFGGLKKDILFL